MKRLNKSDILQFIKFGIVGVSNTLVSFAVYYIFIWIDPKLYLIGSALGWVVSVANAFYWNNKYVFRKGEGQTRNLGRALLKTYVAYGLTGIVLANALSYVWINVFGVSKYVAPLINLVISIPLNFIINKFWAFRTEPES
jgi:putative flippase GtrA